MTFRTELTLPQSSNTISLKNPLFFIGSCFSDTIASIFKSYKFNILSNPFGTVYNPISITKLLSLSIANKYPSENTFLVNDGYYYNFDFHSSFFSPDLEVLKESLKNTINASNLFLKQSKMIVITLGTAWVYQHIASGFVVANCHKIEQKKFVKKLLSINEIIVAFEIFIRNLMNLNPSIRIILTISAVRHSKDNLSMNGISKSILRVATNSLCDKYPNIEYFPSYEIMMDDLRDYRFYKSDMIHPNKTAVDYIWKKFENHYFDKKTKLFIKKWNEILNAMNHKPFKKNSKSHQNFIKNTINKMNELSKIVDCKDELVFLTKQLNLK